MSKISKISDTATRLKEYLEVTGQKQADLVRKTGLSKSVISLYVSGKREPMQDNITTLAESLNVSPAWLMGLDVEMISNKDKEKLIDEYIINIPIATPEEIKEAKELANKIMQLPTNQKMLIQNLVNEMLVANLKQPEQNNKES